jgi:hypothetical protein
MVSTHDDSPGTPVASPAGKYNGLRTKFAFAFVTAALSTAGAAGGGYLTARSNSQAELKVQSRGIARVVQRDLKAAADLLKEHRPGEKVAKNFWEPVKDSDLQKLASKLREKQWERLGPATKQADSLLAAVQPDGSLDLDSASLGEAIDKIADGARSLRAVVRDEHWVPEPFRRRGTQMVAARR